MSSVNRAPAISRRHPAENLPERPPRTEQEGTTDGGRAAVGAPTPAADGGIEKLTEQHNVRIRPSVKDRAVRAVGKIRYETGDSTVSLQSITDAALDEYLTKHGC